MLQVLEKYIVETVSQSFSLWRLFYCYGDLKMYYKIIDVFGLKFIIFHHTDFSRIYFNIAFRASNLKLSEKFYIFVAFRK